jgi:hypothetical protein
MFKRTAKYVILTILPAACLLADFSYEQTSKLTGGAMASMMKVAGVFSKQAREPIRTTIAVKGDRMVTLSPNNATVIDLSKETFTEIDFQKKNYSVMTFAEMKEFLEKMAGKQKQQDAEMKFKVSVNETGQTKQISGFDTRQMIVKMEAEVQDKKNNQTGSFVVTADMWIAPKVAGYDEIATFYRRMSEKINWAPGGGMMMNSSEISKGMAELYKEGSKLNGMPVLQIIRMGGPGGEAQQGQAAAPQQQQQQETQKPSMGGALGGALGGRLGGLGGFGRKKKPAEEPPPAPAAQAEQAPAQQAGGPPSLLEMTSELSNFSGAALDASKFEVPAGFKQVKKNR